jgi:tetratricopeptide (TPR) repeat protein
MARQTPSQWLQEARRLLETGAPEQALRIATAILEPYPLHLQGHRTAAAAYLMLGRLTPAREQYVQCLELDPEDAHALVGLGLISEAHGDYAQAAAQYSRAIEVAPAYVAAQQHLHRVQQEAPSVRSRAWLARIYLRGGLLEHAVAELRYLSERMPERLDLQVCLGYALWLADRRSEAADVCHAVLLRRPRCLKALVLLGELWVNGDRVQEGRALLEQAGQIDPEYALARQLFEDLPPGRLTLPETLPVLELKLERPFRGVSVEEAVAATQAPAAPAAVPGGAVPPVEEGPGEEGPVIEEGPVTMEVQGEGRAGEEAPAAAAPVPEQPGAAWAPSPADDQARAVEVGVAAAMPPPDEAAVQEKARRSMSELGLQTWPAQEATTLVAQAEAALADPTTAAGELRLLAAALARLVDEQGSDVRARRLLGSLYHRLGEYEAAIDQYGEALRLVRRAEEPFQSR